LLRNSARTATVRANGEVELFVLSSESFLEALTGVGDLAAAGDVEALHRGPARWTRRGRVEILSRVSLFAHLDNASLARLADRAVIERWTAGSRLITQGERGDRFFVILEGRAQVVRDGVVVAEVRPGDQVGEIALLYGVARTADVVAEEAVVTLSLYREEFDAAVQDSIVRG
jgi:CRP-like cAMP-binding protein